MYGGSKKNFKKYIKIECWQVQKIVEINNLMLIEYIKWKYKVVKY